MTQARQSRGTRSSRHSPLEILTTIEIFVYRSAVILSFIVYAYKHIREQLGH
jgi:hypothetical protein